MSNYYDYIHSLGFDNIKHAGLYRNQYSPEKQNTLTNNLFYEEENRSKKVNTILDTISFIITCVYRFYILSLKCYKLNVDLDG